MEYPNQKTFVHFSPVCAFVIIPAPLTKRVAIWKNPLDAATRCFMPCLVAAIVASVLHASIMNYSVRK